MSGRRAAIRAFAALRVGYALGLILGPRRVGRAWLGSVAEADTAWVALRGLAARDLVLSLGVLAAPNEPARRVVLLACAVSDAADVGATLAADGRNLPPRARAGTIVLAGGSAAISAGLALRRG